jgi:hypothetical protein
MRAVLAHGLEGWTLRSGVATACLAWFVIVWSVCAIGVVQL